MSSATLDGSGPLCVKPRRLHGPSIQVLLGVLAGLVDSDACQAARSTVAA